MRTGSTWLCDLISSILGTEWMFWAKGRDIPKSKFKAEIEKEPRQSIHIYKMHFTPPERICECIKPGDKNNFVISITRDLRDVAVSKIFYIRYNASMRTIGRLKYLENMRKEFGSNKILDRRYLNMFIQSPHFKHIINNWKVYNNGYEHKNYMLLHYEDLNSNRTLFHFRRICNFIGIHRNPKQMRAAIVRNNFQNKTGRSPGQGANSGFRRKGIVGDYKKWINQKNKQMLEDIINETLIIDEPEPVKIVEQVPEKNVNHLIGMLLENKIIYYEETEEEYKINTEICNIL